MKAITFSTRDRSGVAWTSNCRRTRRPTSSWRSRGRAPPKPKFPVYAALGVPEIWHYEGKAIRCLHLRGGKYEPAETSLAFPFLRPADFQQFLEMLPARDENSMLRAFLDWVRSLRPTQ